MEKKLCEKVMDFVDNTFFSSLPDWVEEHIKHCPQCQKYVDLSLQMRNLPLKKLKAPGEIDYVSEIHPHSRAVWKVGAMVAGIILVVGLGIGIILAPSSGKEMVKNVGTTNTIVASETENIDYYTEIALMW